MIDVVCVFFVSFSCSSRSSCRCFSRSQIGLHIGRLGQQTAGVDRVGPAQVAPLLLVPVRSGCAESDVSLARCSGAVVSQVVRNTNFIEVGVGGHHHEVGGHRKKGCRPNNKYELHRARGGRPPP